MLGPGMQYLDVTRGVEEAHQLQEAKAEGNTGGDLCGAAEEGRTAVIEAAEGHGGGL